MASTVDHVPTTLDQIVADIRVAGSVPLTRARTLPPGAYTSPEIFDLEVERLFRPGWVLVARADHVPEPGDYLAVDLLGERLVVTRDRAGDLHVLSRVCTHRWMSVVEGEGNAKALQCPYHLWTFALSGELVGAPEMQGVEDFDKAACGLPEVRHEEWMGFVFVNLDGRADALGPQLEPLRATFEGYGLQDQVLVETIDWGECEWDWKVMVENFMECYHHLGSHRTTLQADFPGELTWTEDTGDAYSLMHIVPSPTGTAAGRPDGLLANIFPVTIIDPNIGWCFVLRVFPLGAGRIHLYSDHLLARSVAASPGADAARDAARDRIVEIHREDIGICEGVQRSLTGRLAPIGRLSLLEEPLWRLYRFIGARI